MYSFLNQLVSPILSSGRYGLFTGFMALGVLITVFISQYGFGMHPCTLCLWQRWPYAALLVLGFGMHYCTCKRPSLFVATLLIFIAWAASLAISFYHVGVEQHWWEFGGACSSTIYEAGASTATVLERLKNAAVVRCDQSAQFLFGWSMALWNALLSAVMVVISALMMARFYRIAFKPLPGVSAGT